MSLLTVVCFFINVYVVHLYFFNPTSYTIRKQYRVRILELEGMQRPKIFVLCNMKQRYRGFMMYSRFGDWFYMYTRAGISVEAFEFVVIIIIIDLFIWLHWDLVALCGLFVVACGILATRSGIEPGSPKLGAWSSNHWTPREVPAFGFLVQCFFHGNKLLQD